MQYLDTIRKKAQLKSSYYRRFYPYIDETSFFYFPIRNLQNLGQVTNMTIFKASTFNTRDSPRFAKRGRGHYQST